MTGLMIESGHVVGATVRDSFGGPAFEVRARVVVNATGPWSDDIRALDAPASAAGGAKRAAVRGSKGAHIAVRRDRVRNVSALTLLSPRDGRVLFVLPDGARAIVGTTDDYTSSTPDQVRAGNEDVRYLLDAANAFFPSADLVESDVVSAWAGIRPLLPSGGDTPGAASREHAITTNDHGLISITGGKLTTYRVMAGDVVDEAARRLRRPVGACRTDVERLPGGDFESFDALSAEAWKYVAQDDIALHLASAFGTRAVDVAEEIRGTSAPWRLHENLPYTFGELHYSVRNELAFTLGDLLIRRTHLAFETSDHGTSVAPRVAKSIAPLLGWDAAAQGRAIDDYVAEVERIFGTQS
jgi:glycerol-3-phosphate dehydrogenase